MAERFHQRFFKAVPLPEGTIFESLTEAWCGFNVAGPRARDLLRRVTNASLENEDFPFMRSARIDGNRARMFAGGGIVNDSDPLAELQETQLKLQALLSAVVRP